MHCKSCLEPFGLNLNFAVENEPCGKCSGCNRNLCLICAFTPRIETPGVIDPEGYALSDLQFCSSCVQSLSVKVAAA